jgi:hypothetical protein
VAFTGLQEAHDSRFWHERVFTPVAAAAIRETTP